MSSLKIALLSLALVSSTSVLAEGGSDRLVERSEMLAQQRQETTQQVAAREQQHSAQEQRDSLRVSATQNAESPSR